jgi:hypothetical protein
MLTKCTLIYDKVSFREVPYGAQKNQNKPLQLSLELFFFKDASNKLFLTIVKRLCANIQEYL